jgi:hypothetical protein
MTNLAIALMLALQVSLTNNVSQDRLRVVSQDMVSVVDEEFSNGTLKSAITQEDALSMLAAVAVGESSLRSDIENCKTTGDGGRSVGLGQVMRGPNWKGHSRNEICTSRRLQLRLALHVLDACWQRTARPDASFRCYTAGDPNKNSYAAKHEYMTFKRVRSSMNNSIAGQSVQTCCAGGISTFYVREKNTCDL